MECRRCAACGRAFQPRAQVRQQRYCGAAACQRERRRGWQKRKRLEDEDYRSNQARAQRSWASGHGDYWRAYRAAHPGYADRNRAAQRRRDGARRVARLAKMDASTADLDVPSGTYLLSPAVDGGLAKMDALTVKITVLSRGYVDGGGVGAILQREDAIGARGPPG